jgi:hypothetical protein
VRKDNIRDYATEAFRFYAAYGSYAEYKRVKMQAIYEEMAKQEKVKVKNGGSVFSPTEAQLTRAEEKFEQCQAEAEDVRAVERALYIISRDPSGWDIRDCIEAVYFKDADKPLQKGDIQSRVDGLVESYGISDRQVYRCLAKARRIFAFERNLRFC